MRRPERNARHPLHLTSRIRGGLPSLRQARAHALLLNTLRAGADRFGFRLVEFSVQSNHLHLIVEASDRAALMRGARALLVRLARNLNRLWCRKGGVFADRYHVHELKSPAEVRRALVYVLHNARRHGSLGAGIDPFSSGPWFDGFRERGFRELDGLRERRRGNSSARAGESTAAVRVRTRADFIDAMARSPRASCLPRTWLLSVGWRRHGLIGVEESVARTGT